MDEKILLRRYLCYSTSIYTEVKGLPATTGSNGARDYEPADLKAVPLAAPVCMHTSPLM